MTSTMYSPYQAEDTRKGGNLLYVDLRETG